MGLYPRVLTVLTILLFSVLKSVKHRFPDTFLTIWELFSTLLAGPPDHAVSAQNMPFHHPRHLDIPD